MGPSSKEFFDQNGTYVLRIFGEKVTHLGGTSLYTFTFDPLHVSIPRFLATWMTCGQAQATNVRLVQHGGLA